MWSDNGYDHGLPIHYVALSLLMSAPIHFEYRPARPQDAAECIRIRGLTRENAIPEERLHALGVTAMSWAEDIACDKLPGVICLAGDHMVGYCFGALDTGEIVVLALLPDFEGRGVGRELLGRVVALLQARGHQRLFLGCAPDPTVRSYGFYRHLGWRSTGRMDDHGDEILEQDFL